MQIDKTSTHCPWCGKSFELVEAVTPKHSNYNYQVCKECESRLTSVLSIEMDKETYQRETQLGVYVFEENGVITSFNTLNGEQIPIEYQSHIFQDCLPILSKYHLNNSYKQILIDKIDEQLDFEYIITVHDNNENINNYHYKYTLTYFSSSNKFSLMVNLL